MKRLLVAALTVQVTLTSCVSTDVLFESSPSNATVALDGQQIGTTPVTHKIGNGFWIDPVVVVEHDGYAPAITSLEKEVKWGNVLLYWLYFVPLIWVWGPEEEQFVSLRALPESSLPQETLAPTSEPLTTQSIASLERILAGGESVRLGITAVNENGTDAGQGYSGGELIQTHADSVTAELLTRFGEHPSFVFVDRESTREILNELEFQLSGLVERSQLTEYGRLSGATHILVLDYQRREESGLIRVSDRRRLIQIETGTVLASDSTQVTLLWDASSSQYKVVDSTYNGSPVTIVDRQIFAKSP